MSDPQIKALAEAGIRKLILKYSAPSIVSTVASATYNVVDRIFVGRTCGEEALSAITVCFPPSLFLLAISITIGQGSATVASIKLGERDSETAERILGQAIFLFLIFYAAVLSTVLPFMDEFLRFFGATDKILADARSYYSIIICGLIFEKISFGINNLVRAEGHPNWSMATIIVGGVANVFLDWLFLCKFEWGIRGAAYATIAAQACASCWIFLFYFSGKSYLKLRWRNFCARPKLAAGVVYAGSPGFIIQGLSSVVMMLFVRQAGEYGGESAIAVIGIALTVAAFMFLPVVGLSMGIQPIIGYNWGAKNYARVKATFVNAVWLGTFICVCATAMAQIFPDYIYAMFLGFDSPLISTGVDAMRILNACFPFVGLNIIGSGYFQSVKRPVFSIMFTVMRQGVFLMPFLLILPRYFGIYGLWASFPSADFLAFIFTLYFVSREMKLLDFTIVRNYRELR